MKLSLFNDNAQATMSLKL